MRGRPSPLNAHVDTIYEWIKAGKGVSDITNLLADLDIKSNESSVRQAIKRHRKLAEAWQVRQKSSIFDERPVDDKERIKEKSAEAELHYLRRRVSELDKSLVNREAVLQRIEQAAAVSVEPIRFQIAAQDSTKPVRSAVVPIYDVQYGQLVQPTDTPFGIGEFSDSVFQRRLERWVDGVTRSLIDYSKAHNITEIIFPLGGDLVEGADIFRGQAWQLEKDPARQARDLSVHLAAALGYVIQVAQEECGASKVMITAVPGNHGKVGGRSAGAIPSTMSWDWVCTEFLRLEMQKYPVDVWANEPAGALLFETMGQLFLQIHGDEIRGWGGLPFYGLAKYDGRMLRMAGEHYNYCLLGHHHQPATIPNGSGGEYIVSGDWVGANNLSGQIVAASRPQQNLLFVSEKYGITERVPIYFEPATRPRPHIYSA